MRIVSFSGLLLLWMANIACSEDNRVDGSMDVVVTATREERLVKDTPYATSVLSSDSLRIEGPVRTVPEAFKNLPGTMVQKTSHGQGSPYIRGFTGYRNLFLIDGIRLNNSVFRDGPNQYWNTVDFSGLHRIELVRGPFAMLYGSDSVGGTVNALTRGVRDIRPGSNWDRNIYYRYASAENSQIARAESIGQLTDDMALTLGYSFKDFGDIEGGRNVGIQEKTGYDEMDWDAKLEYFFSDRAFLVAAHQSVDIDDAWRTHKTIYGIDWKGLAIGDELRRVLGQDRDLTYMQYHQYEMSGVFDEVHAGISRHVQSEFRDRLRTKDRHDEQGFDVNTLGAFLMLKSLSPIGELIYGAEYYHDAVDSYSRTLNPDGSIKKVSIQGPVADDAEYELLGVYLQDEISLADRVGVILGIRCEYAKADAGAVEDPVIGGKTSVSRDWDNVVGSARSFYYLNNERSVNLFMGISQGFRAPNLSDLTRFDSARTDEIETPAPDLDPERYVSLELGLKIDMSELSLQLACFHTAIDGMIVRVPTGRIIDGYYEVTKKNSGDGFVHGIELNGDYQFCDALTIFGVFTWIDGKLDTYPTSDMVMAKEPIERLMPPTGRAGLRWNRSERYWVECSCAVAAKADKLSSRDKEDASRIPPGGTPGYTVYDVRAGWRCMDDLVLTLAVENIADEDYRVHGSGINEPGRNVVFSTEWTF